MRREYGTAENFANEDIVANRFAKAYGYKSNKTPRFYKVDRVMTKNGNVKCFVEIKCRTNVFDKYPTVILSSDKWNFLYQLDVSLNTPAIMVFSFTDGKIGYIRPRNNADKIKVSIGGRIDRNDQDDIEPVVHIPIGLLTFPKEIEENNVPPRTDFKD
jgi:hypothetical protein